MDNLLEISPPPVSEVPTLTTVNGLSLPTDAYRPTPAEQNLVADAIQLLTTECMARFGFTWSVPAIHVRDHRQTERLYGVADMATAERYGYHLPPRGPDSGSGQTRPNPSMSPNEILVLTGGEAGSPDRLDGQAIPPGGCAGEAMTRVFGSAEIDPERIADAITVAMWRESMMDPRVVAVIELWSSCMLELGYDYESPLDAGTDHPEWLEAPTAGEAEITAAVSDVRCKQTTNLIGVWFTVESAYESAAIDQQIEALEEIKRQWEDAARTAADLMA